MPLVPEQGAVWQGTARRLALTLLMVGVLTAYAGTATATAAPSALPREGIFESCPLDTQMQLCVQRLTAIRDAGFQVVVFPAGGSSLKALWGYAEAAYRLHMSIMWELSNPAWWEQPPTGTGASTAFPAFSATCKCRQNSWMLAFMIHWLGWFRDTYGYYAADDSMLPSGSPGGVPYYIEAIQSLDPHRYVMVGTANTAQTAAYEPMPNLIGAEIYPITSSSLMPVAQKQLEWNDVIQTVEATQAMADAAHKGSAFILQAFTWGDNVADGAAVGVCSATETAPRCYAQLRYPTALEQLQLRNVVLLHAHPQLILWWSFPGTYGAVGGDPNTTYPTGAVAASRWKGLAWAVQEAPPLGFSPDRRLAHSASARRHRHRPRHHA